MRAYPRPARSNCLIPREAPLVACGRGAFCSLPPDACAFCRLAVIHTVPFGVGSASAPALSLLVAAFPCSVRLASVQERWHIKGPAHACSSLCSRWPNRTEVGDHAFARVSPVARVSTEPRQLGVDMGSRVVVYILAYTRARVRWVSADRHRLECVSLCVCRERELLRCYLARAETRTT